MAVRRSRKAPSQEWKQKMDKETEEDVVTEAQRQLRQLLGRQLDTSTHSLQRTLRAADSMFTSPVTYQAQEEGMAPLRSIQSYCSDQETLGMHNKLREAGLSEGEVELAVGEERRGVTVEPSAMQSRIETIQEKLSVRAERLQEASGGGSGVLAMSRHAWEVERSLYRGRGGPSLQHLTTLNRSRSPRTMAAYPSELLSSTCPESEGIGETERAAMVGEGTGEEEVPALPLQLLQRNCLTTDLIKQLPHFHDYSPGEPSSVLYIKNLHRKVAMDDLRAIFGHWREGVWPKLRLLKGRMGGQAFAHFQNVDVASEALRTVNGYLVRDKPLIISYGHHKQHTF